jgi:hypothetical protein
MRTTLELILPPVPSGEQVYPVGRIWAAGDYTYATDKYIVVRLPGRHASVPPECSKKWKIEEALGAAEKLIAQSKPQKLNFDRQYYLEKKPCWGCHPELTSSEIEKCDACGGEGVKVCPTCDHEWNCDDCGGSGYALHRIATPECTNCDGTGIYHRAEFAIKDHHDCLFSAYLIAKILRLPDVMIYPGIGDFFAGVGNPPAMCFTFAAGGVGLIMPRAE